MPPLRIVRSENLKGVRGKGNQALVIGATSGIGRAIAIRLAKAGFSIVASGRNVERGNQLIRELQCQNDQVHKFLACDVSILSNVSNLYQDWRAASNDSPLDVLVLTQGIGTIQGRNETQEGIDLKLSVHYFSRMACIRFFLPHLRASSSPKVLSVLSAGVHDPYEFYKEDFELKQNYSLSNAANAACMYNDVAMESLSKDPLNKGILFIHAHPGFVNTNWGSEMPWYIRYPVRMLQPLGRRSEDCAEFMCHPLLDPNSKGGFLLMGQNANPVKKTKTHDEAMPHIWKSTEELLDRILKSPTSKDEPFIHPKPN